MNHAEIVARWIRANAAKVGTPDAPTAAQMLEETGLTEAEIAAACDALNKAVPPWKYPLPIAIDHVRQE